MTTLGDAQVNHLTRVKISVLGAFALTIVSIQNHYYNRVEYSIDLTVVLTLFVNLMKMAIVVSKNNSLL